MCKVEAAIEAKKPVIRVMVESHFENRALLPCKLDSYYEWFDIVKEITLPTFEIDWHARCAILTDPSYYNVSKLQEDGIDLVLTSNAIAGVLAHADDKNSDSPSNITMAITFGFMSGYPYPADFVPLGVPQDDAQMDIVPYVLDLGARSVNVMSVVKFTQESWSNMQATSAKLYSKLFDLWEFNYFAHIDSPDFDGPKQIEQLKEFADKYDMWSLWAMLETTQWWVQELWNREVNLPMVMQNTGAVGPAYYRFCLFHILVLQFHPDAPDHSTFQYGQYLPSMNENGKPGAQFLQGKFEKWFPDFASFNGHVSLFTGVVMATHAINKWQYNSKLTLAEALSTTVITSPVGFYGSGSVTQNIIGQILPPLPGQGKIGEDYRMGFIAPSQIKTAYRLENMQPFKDYECWPECPACYGGICSTLGYLVLGVVISMLPAGIVLPYVVWKYCHRFEDTFSRHTYYILKKYYAFVEMVSGACAIISFMAMRPERKDLPEASEFIIKAVAVCDCFGGLLELLSLFFYRDYERTSFFKYFTYILVVLNTMAIACYTDFMVSSDLPLSAGAPLTVDYLLGGLEIAFFMTGSVLQAALGFADTRMDAEARQAQANPQAPTPANSSQNEAL